MWLDSWRSKPSQTTNTGTSVRRIASATALALAIAAPAEGLRRVAYYDPPGILTVCAGHTGPDVQKGRVYSLEECSSYLTDDMRAAIGHVERCAPGLPENELAAWGDAVFNLGPAIVCDRARSTAARLLAAGKREEACEQLPKWSKARVAGQMVTLPGLAARRAKEMELCLRSFS